MNQKVKDIFAESMLATLATVNEDGSPWSTPVHIVADEDAIYWFSSEEAQHSGNLARDERVSVTLFSRDESHGPKGVYINGTAEKVSDDARNAVVALYAERAGRFPNSFSEMAAYKVQIGALNEQKSTSNCWYFYS